MRRVWLALGLACWCIGANRVVAQYPDKVKEDDFSRAIQFYREGGSFSFRLAPQGTAAGGTTWTILMLTSASNKAPVFRYGAVELGKGSSLNPIGAGLNVQIVMNHLENRRELFKRIASDIEKKALRAIVVTTQPLAPNAAIPMKGARDVSGPELLSYADWEYPRE